MMRRICNVLFIALLLCTGCGKKQSCADEELHPWETGESAQYFDAKLLLSEDNYIDEMQNVVAPYLESRMRQGTLDTAQGSKIHYETFNADEGADDGGSELPSGRMLPSAGKHDTIVIFAGFSEFTRKHDETTYYFLKSGYNVCIFDHRGLGLSSRDKEIVDDKNAVSLIYIDDFDTYVADAVEVVEKVALPMTMGNAESKETADNVTKDEADEAAAESNASDAAGKAQRGRLLLFAHSMGGCIGALFLEQCPGVFDLAVLSSPMLATNTGVPEWMAYSLSAVMDAVRKGAGMAVGQKTFDPSASNPKNQPSYADSPARVAYKVFLKNGDAHYQTNAATYSWTAHAVKATHQAVKSRNIRKITTPILMFQSEHDTRVRPVGQNRFRRRSDGVDGLAVTLVYYPGVRHEIYNSRNEYLAPYYDRILRFYAGE